MAVDPRAQAILDYMHQAGITEAWTLGAAAARAQRADSRLPPGPAAHVEDCTIAGPGGDLPLRVYRPEAGGHQGCLVFFHGGGFVLGDLQSHDALCRQLSVDAGCAVVSVDYRLAPEHPFPAAVDDAVAATGWAFEHAGELGFRPEQLAVGGDSAGGNLAAVTALLAKRDGAPSIAFQLLVYPATDLRTFDRPSTLENATDRFLTRKDMIWFSDQYAPDHESRHDPRVSPLAAPDLRGLPPALVITAEHDPLRDEAEEYAARLRAAGNQVTLSRYPGMIHAFLSLYAFVDQGRAAVGECARALAAAFRT